MERLRQVLSGEHHRASLTLILPSLPREEWNRKHFAALQRARNRAGFPPTMNLLLLPHLSVLFLCSQIYECLCHNLLFFLQTGTDVVLYLDGPIMPPSLRFSVESRTLGDLQLLLFTSWLMLLKCTRRNLQVSVLHKPQGIQKRVSKKQVSSLNYVELPQN